jgi:hypothetical protein
LLRLVNPDGKSFVKYSAVVIVRCFLLLAVSVVMFAGCGEGNPGTAKVSGKVVYDGMPVTSGTLSFSPVSSGEQEPGKSGTADIKPDGTFVVGTYAEADGAVVGKHRVMFLPAAVQPPEGKQWGPDDVIPPSPFAGLTPKVSEVEINPGENNLTVELENAAAPQ